jgi:hypothetical protein
MEYPALTDPESKRLIRPSLDKVLIASRGRRKTPPPRLTRWSPRSPGGDSNQNLRIVNGQDATYKAVLKDWHNMQIDYFSSSYIRPFARTGTAKNEMSDPMAAEDALACIRVWRT